MPRARPVARKTTARRRIHRYRSKWGHRITPFYIKLELSDMIRLFEEEEPPFVECEIPTMNELQAKGVPEEEWPYYLGYMKRMLVLYRAYTGATLQLEKTNLIEEYVLRGKDRDVLEQVQTVTEVCAGIVVSCEDVLACLEGDFSAWAVYDSFDDPHVNDSTDAQHAIVNALETIALLVDLWNHGVKKYIIATKALGALQAEYLFAGWQGFETFGRWVTARFTYVTGLVRSGMTGNGIAIWKNGDLIQTYTPAQLGLNATKVYSVSISRSGKYIFVSGERAATGQLGWVVLVGS